MCLKIKIANRKEGIKLAKNPNVATRNMVVYKRLSANGKSPIRGFIYERGFHYYQTGNRKLTGSISLSCWGFNFRVDSGLHTYTTERVAKKNKYRAEKIVRMIIPKGALYYKNNRHIVSSELIFPYSDNEIKIYLAENKQRNK